MLNFLISENLACTPNLFWKNLDTMFLFFISLKILSFSCSLFLKTPLTVLLSCEFELLAVDSGILKHKVLEASCEFVGFPVPKSNLHVLSSFIYPHCQVHMSETLLFRDELVLLASEHPLRYRILTCF